MLVLENQLKSQHLIKKEEPARQPVSNFRIVQQPKIAPRTAYNKNEINKELHDKKRDKILEDAAKRKEEIEKAGSKENYQEKLYKEGKLIRPSYDKNQKPEEKANKIKPGDVRTYIRATDYSKKDSSKDPNSRAQLNLSRLQNLKKR